MTRNLVPEENAENNRSERYPKGGYTFNAFPPEEYEGRIFVVAVMRLGDHAHVEFHTGRQVPVPSNVRRPTLHYGRAGMLVMQWADWLVLREVYDADERFRIAEVENPTDKQLDYHLGGKG